MRNLILFFAWLLWLVLAGTSLLQIHWELALLVFAALCWNGWLRWGLP